MKHSTSAAIAAAVALLAPVAAAIAYVATNAWFGAGDLSAMVVWSSPLALLVFLGVRAAAPRLEATSVTARYAAFVTLGALVAIGWTLAVAVVLGGWILAFSFPVLLCWVWGGLLAGTMAAWLPKRRSWPVAVVLVLAISGGLLRLNAYARAPAPRARIVLVSTATDADRARFWREVIGQPGRRPTETAMLDGLSSAGVTAPDAGRPAFIVTFEKGLGRQRRDSIIARIRRAPIVARVELLAGSSSGGRRRVESF